MIAGANPKLTLPYASLEALDPGSCDEVVRALDNSAWSMAGVANYARGQPLDPDRNVRVALQQPIPASLSSKLLRCIGSAIGKVNHDIWRFDIHGFDLENDPPRVVAYDASMRGHFEWHVDLVPSASTRKLAFSLQLTSSGDYDGSDLEFFLFDHDHATRRQGTIIIFPAYGAHRVSPIQRGRRLVIVGWVHGRAFR